MYVRVQSSSLGLIQVNIITRDNSLFPQVNGEIFVHKDIIDHVLLS